MGLSTDVLVIGGGVVGAASAYHLARRGASVILLEANQLASGATGRNLGYIWVHTRRIGPGAGARDGHPIRRSRPSPRNSASDFGLRTNGGLIYFNTEEQAVVMREFVERRTADGVPMRLLDGDEARAMAPILPDTVLGASYCPLDAQIDSTRYVRAFAAAAQRAGARVVEGSVGADARVEGRADHPRADRYRADLGGARRPGGRGLEPVSRGPARARPADRADAPPDRPDRADGAASRRRSCTVRRRSSSTPTSASSRRTRPEPFETELEDRLGLALLESACQKPDGSYLLGIAMDFPGFDWQPDLAGVSLISEGMAAAIPEFRGARFARAWAGVLPLTSDSLPIIDRAPGFDDLVIAAGHVFGNGAGPTTGKLVADLVCGGEPTIDLTPFRADRPSLRPTEAGRTW